MEPTRWESSYRAKKTTRRPFFVSRKNIIFFSFPEGEKPAGPLVHPQRTDPPLTFRISPLICRAHSLHRKTIGHPISSGEATRPTGIESSIDLRKFGSAKTSAHMSVSTQPGATELTLMPKGPSSAASDFVKAICPPFEAA